MLRGDKLDAAIMAELSNPALGRAMLAPVTLASIGLDALEWKAIALGEPLPSDTIVTEYSLDEFEQVSLCSHGLPIQSNTVFACLGCFPLEVCPHGVLIFDHEIHAECNDCEQSRAESASVPRDWFAGGFADNH